jgi:phosphate-selective porin OprO/OprP
MKHPQHSPRSLTSRSATATLLATLLAAGPVLAQAPSPAPDNAPATASPQAATLPAVDAELIRQLLGRIEQLEKREAARSIELEGETTKRLQQRIAELEQKLGALESGGKVLPEIAVTGDDAPTTTELDRKIRGLEERTAAEATAALDRASKSPILTVGTGGLRFSSADTNFTFSVKGLIQTDSHTYFSDNELNEGNDTFGIRRARLLLRGTLYRDIHFEIIPQWGGINDQGSVLQDAAVAYKLGEHFEIKAGKFKGPVGLGLLQSIAYGDFSERSLVSGLVPFRNVGTQLSANFFDGALQLAGGVFNNAGDGRNPGSFDFTDAKEYAGRVFVQPFKGTELKLVQGLGFGVGGSYSQVSSNALGLPAVIGEPLPGYYTSPGTQQFFAYDPLVGPVVADGAHWRLSPQGHWYAGPFGLLGEYALSSQNVYNSTTFRSARLTHSAWHIGAQWFLTGEKAGFAAVEPRRPFSLGNPGWGAWQVVGRFSRFDIDDDAFPSFSNPDFSATDATSWSVGLNWWLNRNLRVLASFTHTSFSGGGAPVSITNPGSVIPPSTVTAQDENLFSARIQLSF